MSFSLVLCSLFRHFNSYQWNFPESSAAYFTSVIVSTTYKFIPSCVPKLCRPTPWWNHHCEVAWQNKIEFWHSADDHRFHKASLNATRVYSAAS